eukprot:TRINITY_DN6867_c0_g1_i1.p2 TRINITY_DN6867_c0_g1~~TRINITY_DN6867_c0_g1_i1.p2  ORF type:complete len:124 (-),score=18.81 TRINITY_DN6867_c0_g1_i1:63-434(-)
MAEKVDRTKACPFLLRCFLRPNSHNRPDSFQREESLPRDELQIYTWTDATLREVTSLVQGVHDLPRRRNARLEFSFVYPDKMGKMVMREVGSVHSSRKGPSDDATLKELRFQTGDYIDIAVYT